MLEGAADTYCRTVIAVAWSTVVHDLIFAIYIPQRVARARDLHDAIVVGIADGHAIAYATPPSLSSKCQIRSGHDDIARDTPFANHGPSRQFGAQAAPRA